MMREGSVEYTAVDDHGCVRECLVVWASLWSTTCDRRGQHPLVDQGVPSYTTDLDGVLEKLRRYFREREPFQG